MLEDFFTQPRVVAQIRSEPLGPYLDDFATLLHQQGYHSESIRRYLSGCRQFGQWLTQHRHPITEVSADTLHQYIHSLRRSPTGKLPPTAQGVRHLMTFLQRQGVILSPTASLPPTDADQWLQRYAQYLEHVLGAALSTRQNYLRFAQRFLTARFGTTPIEWAGVDAQDFADFVRQEAATKRGLGRKAPAAAVRAFLRFLVFSGHLRPGLEAAIPSPRHAMHAALPTRLTVAEVERVLALYTGTTPKALRNCAILVLLARLGLRAREVAGLRLDDIDWHAGRLRILPGKTHRARLLPLSEDVGQALAAYLVHGRPTSASRIIFLNWRPPFRPLAGASAISRVARRAMERAGIPARPLLGAHTFRHTVASQMVNHGASFKDVADVLGHQSLQTTGIYAKLDLEVLAAVALPWRGDAP
jgi:site-specific recombinase XerD